MTHDRDQVARLQKRANDLGCTYALAVLIDGLEKDVARLREEIGAYDDPVSVSFRLAHLERMVF